MKKTKKISRKKKADKLSEREALLLIEGAMDDMDISWGEKLDQIEEILGRVL